jgi:hypothetical protein
MGYDNTGSTTGDVPEAVAKAVDQIQATGNRVEIIGTYENGRLQLDQATLGRLEGKFAFVAVNAPFAG